MDASLVERLADLVVGFGANVQRGQVVDVASNLGKEGLTRAIVASAYRRGAKFVDVDYFDPHVKRARILHLEDEDDLDFVPPWASDRVRRLGEERAAAILLSGPSEPHLLEDLDASRVGRDRYPNVPEWIDVINARTVNWCIAPCPTPRWAQLVYPDLEPDAALDRLWGAVATICRLDADDPVAAWRDRVRAIERAAERLTEQHFDAIHLEGPGTDLTIGLLPSSRWLGGGATTIEGLEHMPNLPTEEVFTTPDPERADGYVRSTMPLRVQGRLVEGLTVRFEAGRATSIDAETGAETIRAFVERPDGGTRLGEVALVDRGGRIGALETVFYDTLLDENAASHIALGSGIEFAVGDEDRDRVNRSIVHVDFMVGAPEVDVTGITSTGERVPVLRDAEWQL